MLLPGLKDPDVWPSPSVESIAHRKRREGHDTCPCPRSSRFLSLSIRDGRPAKHRKRQEQITRRIAGTEEERPADEDDRPVQRELPDRYASISDSRRETHEDEAAEQLYAG